MRSIKYSEAISEGIVQEMESNPNIFITGIAVDYPSGIFGTTIDAFKKALSYTEQFLNMGKKVYLVDMQDKDPSEMGFASFTRYVQQAEEMDFGKLLRYKLS